MDADRLVTSVRNQLAKALALGMLALLFWGRRVECTICGGRYRKFLAFGGRTDAFCPRCGSLERNRLIWLYLRHGPTSSRLRIPSSTSLRKPRLGAAWPACRICTT
jgi:hypothetical protein